jgi:hypothetical protein
MLFPDILKCLALSSLLLSDGALSKPVGSFGQLSREYKTSSRQSHGPIQRRAPAKEGEEEEEDDDDDDDDDEDPERDGPASSLRFLNSQTSGEWLFSLIR